MHLSRSNVQLCVKLEKSEKEENGICQEAIKNIYRKIVCLHRRVGGPLTPELTRMSTSSNNPRGILSVSGKVDQEVSMVMALDWDLISVLFHQLRFSLLD